MAWLSSMRVEIFRQGITTAKTTIRGRVHDRILVLRLWENHQIRKSYASKLHPKALPHSDAQKD
ncbi:hypothetical protein QMN93_03120 [Enterobacter sp. R-1.6.2]|uniref:hypothetical protein n=1 Tax=Enterobacter TaxID=547 RepID=UPI002B243B9F|nr:hypothetical protein [Enterobacter sp. R-1.6.2]MEB2379960.1 hypothetical protein [Enterobacter sp. R-1.5.3]MEB2427297.1 hypothetical protein [Enterobacter sp. R-1.6.2]